MKKLVIGSGPGWTEQKVRYQNDGIEAVSVDIIPEFEPDEVRDILRGLPFNSNQFDEVEIFHCLEHIQSNQDFLFVMNDIYRVLKVGGTVSIAVPHFESPSALNVYEHVRLFSVDTFCNFYDNPYAKEMGIKLFEHVEHCIRPKDGGQEVFVRMRKI